MPNAARLANRETPVALNTARPTNRETPTMPNTARNETREAAPPGYTKQVEHEATGAPRIERGPVNDESASGQNPEINREDSLSELGTGTQSNQELGGSSTGSGNLATTETTVIERNVTEPQDVRIALDREIVETIRGIAREQRSLRTELTREQRNLRGEIQGTRQDQRNL